MPLSRDDGTNQAAGDEKKRNMQLEDSESGKKRPVSWWPMADLLNGFVCVIHSTENKVTRDGDHRILGVARYMYSYRTVTVQASRFGA